jgi:hypothetical protein
VVWTHPEWKKAKKNAAPGEPGYEYEDSPFKHPWGWMVKDVPEHVGLGYYDAWLRCNEPLLAKLHLLYNKILPCWCRFDSPCKCHTGILRRYAKASGGRSLIPVAEHSIPALLKKEGSSPSRHAASPPASPPSSPLVRAEASPRGESPLAWYIGTLRALKPTTPAPFISLDDEEELPPPRTPTAPPIEVDADDELPPPAQDVDAHIREDEL